MLLSYALFVASAAATALSSSQLEARKAKDGDSTETGNSTKTGNPATDQPSDENIPKDEPFCLCIDLSLPPEDAVDETLTEDVCGIQGGQYATYKANYLGDKLLGGCFSYDFFWTQEVVDSWTDDCLAQSGNQCKYIAACYDKHGYEIRSDPHNGTDCA
ncbi:hypothetical protein SMMN14_07170 [Sphaerulina musiva]